MLHGPEAVSALSVHVSDHFGFNKLFEAIEVKCHN